MSQLTLQEVYTVSAKAIAAVSQCGMKSCLTGGAGCVLYGCARVPHVRSTNPTTNYLSYDVTTGC